MIILDTNVLSEFMRGDPDPAVLEWLREHASDALRTTAVTVAEINYGLARLPDSRRRAELEASARQVFGEFAADVLSFDVDAADHYGKLVAAREHSGAPISALDAQIAAICQSHGAVLATRNVDDFAGTGITIDNPWPPAR